MTDYAPLPSSPDEVPEKVSPSSPWDKWLTTSALIMAILSTLLSFSIYLTGANPLDNVVTSLKRPSPYPNLQFPLSSNASTAPFPPIYSLSQVLMQLRNDDGIRTMYEDTSRQRSTMEGTVFPDDRHFIVNRELSTIIQLKTLDWGMERCVLNAVLPNRTAELDPAIHMEGANVLDIWRLDFDEEITIHDPQTWSKAPKRRSHFAQFVFPPRSVWSSVEFHCPSLTWNTFEFSCAPTAASCHVEFWQDRASPNGIYLQQFDSVHV